LFKKTETIKRARIEFSSFFRPSYQAHLETSPKIAEKLEKFLIFKQERPSKRLPVGFSDHTLSGKLDGFRECHLEGDSCLIYTDKQDVVKLILICTHDELKQRGVSEKDNGFFKITDSAETWVT